MMHLTVIWIAYLSFGMTIRVSTFFLSVSTPSAACKDRPSNQYSLIRVIPRDTGSFRMLPRNVS